ncbi:LutC/YkgG family protein [Umezawaea beigongshangensis]|uniref:LutC/YkgG family protein n=1 Tax=Umezawaea beigongshangensis TaxID=2780383 RepID=UPI0018F1BD5A|nr:lactate utilization protein C [Umezawaea beigongshangensis]
MADARGEILARIRGALADRPETPEVPRDYLRALPRAADLLAERIAHYRATVHRVDAAGLPVAIGAALRRRGAVSVAAPADLPPEWLVSGVRWMPDSPPLSTEQLDGCDGVVTGCAVAVAETGTLVLDAGPAQGRRVLTLLPDYHLCVVRAEQIAGTVPEALARLEPTRPLTFVSGPSATSDIELDRVEGVHGPRTLEVLLVESRPAEH